MFTTKTRRYLGEIISQVLAHADQMRTNGCCNCCNKIQTVCLPAERLASVMRGETQNFKEDTLGVTPYEFVWTGGQDDNQSF